MSSNTISTYLIHFVSIIFTYFQRIIIQHYNMMRIFISFFAKYWTEYSIFSSKIASSDYINDYYEHHKSQSATATATAREETCFDFDESEEIYDSVATNFNHVLKIEQESHKPREDAKSLMPSIEKPFRVRVDQLPINPNVLIERLTSTNNNPNKKLHDHRANRAYLKARKSQYHGYVSNTWLKLEEYNEKNNEYLLNKGVISRTNLNNIYPITSFSSLPRLSKTIASSSVRGNKGNTKSNKPKLYKRKHLPFRPTELSTIFENLAY